MLTWITEIPIASLYICNDDAMERVGGISALLKYQQIPCSLFPFSIGDKKALNEMG